MLILNNNCLTVKYEGQTYSKEVSPDELTMIKVYAMDNDLESIIKLCFPTSKSLLKREGFWEEDASVYYKNIKVSIPTVLAVKMLEASEEEFQRLIKFWGWLSLNPNPRTRENLYGWVEKNGVQLTNGGLMILYRRVVSLNPKDTELGKFVKEIYEKFRKQKKSTNIDVYVDMDMEYFTSHIHYGETTMVGNLKQLHLELDVPCQVFTDNHTRQERYEIGKESFMSREAGDESDSQCSKGYHAGSQDFSFSGFGDTPIAIVVNPMDVLNSVENHYKMRFTRFTPVAILNKDAEWINDPEVHNRIDSCYDTAVDRLETLLNQANFEDFKKHEVLANEWNLAVGFETVLKLLNKQ